MSQVSLIVHMNSAQIDHALENMAEKIAQAIDSSSSVPFIGIQQGGDIIATKLAQLVQNRRNVECPIGTLDITLYRDDAATSLPDPQIGPTNIPFEVHGKDVVLVDDVLQTGRTVRAALNGLLDHGRPSRIWFATLVDRGQRELPIRADFIGASLHVSEDHIVKAQFPKDSEKRVVSFPFEFKKQVHSK